jgi:hypothetical protein
MAHAVYLPDSLTREKIAPYQSDGLSFGDEQATPAKVRHKDM